MKLKTTCTQHIISGSTDDFSHDAAAAHALVMAIGELPNRVREQVESDAAEILAEWGYRDGGG